MSKFATIGNQYLASTRIPVYGTTHYVAYALDVDDRISTDEYGVDMINFVMVNKEVGSIESMSMAYPTIVSLCNAAEEAIAQVKPPEAKVVNAFTH